MRCRKHALGQLDPGDVASLQACAAEASRFFGESLTRHFEAEETVLFPLMAEYPESRELVARLQGEHREFHDLVARAGDPRGLRKFLFDFGDLLERHIRSEERGLFPAFEKLVPPEAADRAGRELRRILEGSRTASRDPGPPESS